MPTQSRVLTGHEAVASSGDGLTAEQHEMLHHLIHFIDEGPACGFASGAFKEVLPLGAPFPTSIIWWTSAAKTQKIVEKLITRAGGGASNTKPTPVQWLMYDETGVLRCEVSDAIVYSGAIESTRTRTITVHP